MNLDERGDLDVLVEHEGAWFVFVLGVLYGVCCGAFGVLILEWLVRS